MRSSARLIRQSAKLVPPFAGDPPHPAPPDPPCEAMAQLARYEQALVHELREIGYFMILIAAWTP
jgi:hypothetical protein